VKQGLRVMDSDIHVFEPLSLWTEYLEPRFRDRAPTAPGRGPIVWEGEGKAIPAFLDQPEKQRAWRVRMRRALSGGPAAYALKAARATRGWYPARGHVEGDGHGGSRCVDRVSHPGRTHHHH
jgi:hypothetical protein